MLLFGCNGNGNNRPDTSTIKIDLETHRFDVDLYAIDTNHIGADLQKLSVKYPDFLNFFLDTFMGFGIHGHYSDTIAAIDSGLRIYLTYKDFVQLEDTIKAHFPDTKAIEVRLKSGFQNMKYYFPHYHIPKIYYVNTELNKPLAFTIDTSIIGIGLDMFLGDNFAPYAQTGIAAYLYPHLRPAYIPVEVFKVIYTNTYPFEEVEKNLLDLMIQHGKQQYFLHQILPGTPDSVLFAFTQKQVFWCEHNEVLIYNYFIHNNLLYEKELLKTLPYVNDGPFARGLGSSSDQEKLTPGNIGSWLGYRIVSSYMAQHTAMRLPDLLNEKKEAALFLQESKYKPK